MAKVANKPVMSDAEQEKIRLAAVREESKVDQIAAAGAVDDMVAATLDVVKDEKEKAAVAVDAEIISAIVRSVPNCNYVALNGIRIAVAEIGDRVKIPRAFVKAFPFVFASNE